MIGELNAARRQDARERGADVAERLDEKQAVVNQGGHQSDDEEGDGNAADAENTASKLKSKVFMNRSSKLTFRVAKYGIKKHEMMPLLSSDKVVKLKSSFNKQNELVFLHVDQCSEQSKFPWRKSKLSMRW